VDSDPTLEESMVTWLWQVVQFFRNAAQAALHSLMFIGNSAWHSTVFLPVSVTACIVFFTVHILDDSPSFTATATFLAFAFTLVCYMKVVAGLVHRRRQTKKTGQWNGLLWKKGFVSLDLRSYSVKRLEAYDLYVRALMARGPSEAEKELRSGLTTGRMTLRDQQRLTKQVQKEARDALGLKAQLKSAWRDEQAFFYPAKIYVSATMPYPANAPTCLFPARRSRLCRSHSCVHASWSCSPRCCCENKPWRWSTT
jgi:hypothetical protein